jgi:hypothetical protein
MGIILLSVFYYVLVYREGEGTHRRTLHSYIYFLVVVT